MDVRNPGSRGLRGVVAAPRLAWAVVRSTARGFAADRAVERAAALAYITLLSLVPGLAAVVSLARSLFSAHAQEIVAVVTSVLPYSTDAVERTLAQFAARAATLGGVSFVIFSAIAFRLFLAIEQLFNEIWGVARGRPFSSRLFSFTVVLLWGPVLLGMGSTALVWLARQPWGPSVAAVTSVGRLLLPFVGFTMVYWLAPNTKVHFPAALAGGTVAGLGLEGLRWGFVAYLQAFPDINLIFGSLALAVIFLTSLFLLWAVVIAGAEVSYVIQNLEALQRQPEEPGGPHPDPESTALAMILLAFAEMEEGRSTALDHLAARLGIAQRYARELADRLVATRLLALAGAGRDELVPTAETARLTLAEVLQRLGAPGKELPEGVRELPWFSRLQSLLGSAEEARIQALGAKRIADLIAEEELARPSA